MHRASIFVTAQQASHKTRDDFTTNRLAPEKRKNDFLAELLLRVSPRILIRRKELLIRVVRLKCLFFSINQNGSWRSSSGEGAQPETEQVQQSIITVQYCTLSGDRHNRRVVPIRLKIILFHRKVWFFRCHVEVNVKISPLSRLICENIRSAGSKKHQLALVYEKDLSFFRDAGMNFVNFQPTKSRHASLCQNPLL